MEARSLAQAGAQPGGRSTATAADGTRLFVRDWGDGRPVVFLSAWTFCSDVWGFHIAELAARGHRCVAYDRRGHGRSEDPGRGYDADTLADDLAAVLEQRDLTDVTLVAHSMGSTEAVRYLVRHGSGRVARLMLVAPVTPYLTRTEDNPDAIPGSAFDAMRATIAADFPKWLSDNEAPFFTPETSRETRDWIRGIMVSVALPTVLACHRTFTQTDFRADMALINRPTLIVHGDRDASAPLEITGARTAQLIPESRLAVYEGAPHALFLTHKERLVAELMAFLAA
ncbi:alpha/beta hydrolase [Arenibaculum sp.]|uniref:alpha/beta fold hydrolase n=1 Tax=Arenibaculum sp. TaxID=2865862 RepID=UPI002E0DC099|nr:alpha/beta hydrolase [Arenibaculum sp.]